MSGLIKDNIFGSSGSIIAAAGGLSWQPVVTASTVTVSSGKGYFINTTSNACTITLPSSAEAGDQIILADYARNWGTNAITIDSNGLNFQGETDAFIVDYDTAGQAINLVYSGATVGWTPASDIVSAFEPVEPPTQRAIFAYGDTTSAVQSLSNLVSSSGVVASDTAGVGTARLAVAGAGYGGDKAIFGFGKERDDSADYGVTNLVSNSGVVASDTSAVGTSRYGTAAAGYGADKAIFAYGYDLSAAYVSMSNLVSNSGVVASDVTGVGTARADGAGARYGTDKALIAFGVSGGGYQTVKNLISNSGVVASDSSGVGPARSKIMGAGYGGDKAVFAYGYAPSASISTKNLVSNTGVMAGNVTGVGTARNHGAAANYGGDKAIFGFGDGYNLTNLCSNTGVIATDVTGVGTTRYGLGAAGYSFSA